MPEIDHAEAAYSDPRVPNAQEFSVDEGTTAAIEAGIRAANEGRLTSSDEVRKLVQTWTSRSSTQNPR
jgi:predicted transcriptional regulator